jgi:hypothetical protein
MRGLATKLWTSPMFTTWGAYLARSLHFFLLTPFILKIFPNEDVSLWFLFGFIINMQNMFDLGLGVTFVRLISYGYGGASKIPDVDRNTPLKGKEKSKNFSSRPNWNFVGELYSTMRVFYLALTFGFFLILAIGGTLLLEKPILRSSLPNENWVAWIVLVISISISLNYQKYNIFLQGTSHIPLLRRWETLIRSFGTLITLFILLRTNNLLYTVLSNQSWLLIGLVRDYYLAHFIENSRLARLKSIKFNNQLFKKILPISLKSWVGSLMSVNIVRLSGFYYAQFDILSDTLPGYLFSVKLFSMIKDFISIPFYSKLPQYAKLYARQSFRALLASTKRTMRLSHILYLTALFFILNFGELAFSLIRSNVQFPSEYMILIFGIAYMFINYGSMHLQLYTLSNDVKWHIADGIAGSISLLIMVILFQQLKILSFPVGMLIGNMGFYALYSSRLSYNHFSLNFKKYDYQVFFLPLFTVFTVYLLFTALKLLINRYGLNIS